MFRTRAGQPLGDPVKCLVPGGVAGTSVPPERTNGVVRRTFDASTAGAVRPLPHSAPRFTGKSVRSLTSTVPSGVGVRLIPHRRAQYGQCVGVTEFSMPLSVLRACYAPGGSVLRGRDGDLPAPLRAP
ncbi:hypothetical protein SALBM311S_05512 [Streptomyces alboniger]